MLESAPTFYKTLFNKEHPSPPNLNPLHPICKGPSDLLQALEEPFSDKEILVAIKHLPENKVPGPDGLPAEIYQHDPAKTLPYMWKLIDQVFVLHTPPPNFSDSITTLIFNKFDPTNPSYQRKLPPHLPPKL